MTKMSRVKAIKTYFAQDPHGRPVTTSELKVLNSEERQELAEGCAQELGVELEVKS